MFFGKELDSYYYIKYNVVIMRLNQETIEAIITQTCRDEVDTIDLSACVFAEIPGLLRLVLLIKHLSSLGRSIEVIVPRDPNVQSYFERTNAFRELKGHCSMDQSVDHLASHGRHRTKALVELRPVEEMDQIRAIVEGVAEALSKENVPNDSKNVMERILYETLQNVPQHADPLGLIGKCNGFAALQRYDFQLCLAVGDLGIGIRESLITNPKFPKDHFDHSKAVQTAITGASRHGDVGRGGGLQSVVNILEKIGGELHLRSGDAVMHVSKDQRIMKKRTIFPGTHLDIVVPLHNRN